MARRADDLPDDPVLVVLDEDEPVEALDAWLELLAADGATEGDAGAGEIVRDIRERGEA
jgi:hypothetical protein